MQSLFAACASKTSTIALQPTRMLKRLLAPKAESPCEPGKLTLQPQGDGKSKDRPRLKGVGSRTDSFLRPNQHAMLRHEVPYLNKVALAPYLKWETCAQPMAKAQWDRPLGFSRIASATWLRPWLHSVRSHSKTPFVHIDGSLPAKLSLRVARTSTHAQHRDSHVPHHRARMGAIPTESISSLPVQAPHANTCELFWPKGETVRPANPISDQHVKHLSSPACKEGAKDTDESCPAVVTTWREVSNRAAMHACFPPDAARRLPLVGEMVTSSIKSMWVSPIGKPSFGCPREAKRRTKQL